MNLGVIRSQAYHRLAIAGGDSVDDDFANEVINRQYERLVGELGMNQRITPLTLIQDSPAVDLPPDLLRALTYTRTGHDELLVRIDAEEWAEAGLGYGENAPLNAQVGPVVFTEDGVSRILVRPTPEETQAEGLELRYVAVPTPLSLDTDEPVHIPQAYHEVLVERACQDIALAEEELGLMQAAEQREAALMARMKRDAARRPGGHRTRRPRGLPPSRLEH